MVKPVKIPITATDKTGRAFGSVKGRLSSLKSNLVGLSAAVTGAFAVKAIAGFAKEMIDLGDEFQKTSLRIGVGVEALSQYKTVAELSGFSLEKFITGLKKLQKSSQDAAAGLSTAKRGFEALGINIDKFKKLAPELQFEVMVEALGNVESASLRTQVAMDLMGRSGVDLLTVVDGGVEGLRELRMQTALLGGTMTEETAKAFAELNDSITLASVGLTSLVRDLILTGKWVQRFFDGITVVTLRVRQFFDLIDKDQLKKMREEWEKANEVIGETGIVTTALTAEQEKATKAVEKLRKKHKEAIKVIRLENVQRQQLIRTFKFGTQAVTEFKDAIELENKAMALGIEFNTELGDQWVEAARKAQVLQKEVSATENKFKELRKTGMDMGNTIAKGFESIITRSASVKDALAGVLQSIAAIAVRTAVTEPLGKFIGGGLGDLFSGGFPGFASGGSFEVGGRGGTDNNLVAFKATKGEQVDIKTPAQQRQGGNGGVVQNIMIDMTNAMVSVDAFNRLERLVTELNGSIEPRAISAVITEKQRNPVLFGA